MKRTRSNDSNTNNSRDHSLRKLFQSIHNTDQQHHESKRQKLVSSSSSELSFQSLLLSLKKKTKNDENDDNNSNMHQKKSKLSKNREKKQQQINTAAAIASTSVDSLVDQALNIVKSASSVSTLGVGAGVTVEPFFDKNDFDSLEDFNFEKQEKFSLLFDSRDSSHWNVEQCLSLLGINIDMADMNNSNTFVISDQLGERAKEYARRIALCLIQFQKMVNQKLEKVEKSEKSALLSLLNQRTRVLCETCDHLWHKNVFDRSMFVSCLLQCDRHVSQMECEVMDLRVLSVLDERQLVSFESYVQSFCVINERLNSVLLVSHLAKYWSTMTDITASSVGTIGTSVSGQAKKDRACHERYVDRILKLFQKFVFVKHDSTTMTGSGSGGASDEQEWKRAQSLFGRALRGWKTNQYGNNRAVIEIYVRYLQLGIVDMEFVLREVTHLLSPERTDKNLIDLYKCSHQLLEAMNSTEDKNDNGGSNSEQTGAPSSVLSIGSESLQYAFKSIMHLISVQQVLNVINSCIRTLSCDWSILVLLLSYLYKSHASDVTRYLNEVFEESMTHQFADLTTVIIVLCRHIFPTSTQLHKQANQSSYESWLRNNVVRHFTTRKDANISGKILKRNRQYLLSVLTSMIPHDSVTFLKQMVLMLESGLDCSDYITAVKDKLKELGSSTDKFSVTHFLASKPVTSELSDIVRRALLDFEKNNMAKIPQNIANKQFLDRVWYTKQFLPALLTFDEAGPERNRLRLSLRAMVQLMIKKSMIDGSVMLEYGAKINEIKSFEPVAEELEKAEEEEMKVIYIDKVDDTEPTAKTHEMDNDQKRFATILNTILNECSISFRLDSWKGSFERASDCIAELKQDGLPLIDAEHYMDSIFQLFAKCTDIIAKYDSVALEAFCSLFCSFILCPLTFTYPFISDHMMKALQSSSLSTGAARALGLLIGNMCQLKYYRPDSANLTAVACEVLDGLYPVNLDTFIQFSFRFLRYCFDRFHPVCSDDISISYRSKQLIHIPIHFALRVMWTVDRQSIIGASNGEHSPLFKRFQRFIASAGFASFVRGKDLPLSMLIECEMFLPQQQQTNSAQQQYSLVRDRLLSVYLGKCDMKLSMLFYELLKETMNCYLKHVQHDLCINQDTNRVIVSILQELQPLVTTSNPLFDLLLTQMSKCANNCLAFKFVELSSKLMLVLDTRVVFGSFLREPNLETRFSKLRSTVLQFSHIYSWPFEFTILLFRVLIAICEVHVHEPVVRLPNEQLRKLLSTFLHSVPLFKMSLLKLWTHADRTHIQAVLAKVKCTDPSLSLMLDQLIVEPIINMDRSLALVFKNHRYVSCHSITTLCKYEPTVTAIALIEYSLHLQDCAGTSSGHQQHNLLSPVSQSSFSLRLTDYNLNTIQSSYSKVLGYLSVEMLKNPNDQSIRSFFFTGIGVLAHSLIHQVVLRITGPRHDIPMAQFLTEEGQRSIEALKTICAKHLITVPESILFFGHMLHALDLGAQIESDEVSSNSRLDYYRDMAKFETQLPVASLMRLDGNHEEDVSVMRAAVVNAFFILITKMSHEWMQQSVATIPTFGPLFRTMIQLLCHSLALSDNGSNMARVLRMQEKKLKEFMATQSFLVRESLQPTTEQQPTSHSP